MHDDQTTDKCIVSLSSNLFFHQNTTTQFFDRSLLAYVNGEKMYPGIMTTITVLTPETYRFHSLLWADREEFNAPYKEFIKKDRFMQYIRDRIVFGCRDGGADLPCGIYRTQDFFSEEEYNDEPYIRFLDNNYSALGFKYCIKAPLGKGKNYWLNMFKTTPGRFSDRETDYCANIVEILNSANLAFEESRTGSVQKSSRSLIPGLTDREMEIVRELADGRSYQQVARDLFISVSTVRSHIENIFRKLNITNQRQLLQLYYTYK